MSFFRINLVAFLLITFSTYSYANNAAPNVKNFLLSGVPQVEQCSAEHNAIMSTTERLNNANFPLKGKFVIVNIPGGFLTAYEDAVPVMEMKVIIGKEDQQTPEFDTEITTVRLNPTWTVPNSIIKEDDWKTKLKEDKDFFLRNRFEFRDHKNLLLSLEEASNNPDSVDRFVQSPGPWNALGKFRFNIKSADSIYLHDTRDPENFYDGSPITLSHGCVRLEKPKEFALWLLDWDEPKLDSFLYDGSTLDFPLKKHVPISIGYYTAWPNNDNEIFVYEDIYDLDKKVCSR